MLIILGTNNNGKVREIRAIYRQWSSSCPKPPVIKFSPLSDFPDAPTVKETGRTYLDNAVKKAVTWARYTGHLVLAEDSGLEVKALGWKPGLRSARYASKPDSHQNATDQANYTKLLTALKGLPLHRRRARYCCAAVLAHPAKGVLIKTKGGCPGYIAFQPAGHNGFGYDPAFYPAEALSLRPFGSEPLPNKFGIPLRRERTQTCGYANLKTSYSGKTFGQLPAYLKHRISHRGKAVRNILKQLT